MTDELTSFSMDKDEWYPFLTFSEDSSHLNWKVHLPAAMVTAYREAVARFEETHDTIKKRLKEQGEWR